MSPSIKVVFAKPDSGEIMNANDWQNTFPKLVEDFRGTGVIVGLRSGLEFVANDMWPRGKLVVCEMISGSKRRTKNKARYVVTSYEEISYVIVPRMHDVLTRNGNLGGE